VKQRATPKASAQLSTAKVNKIKSMVASGYNNSEIAEAIGVSTSLVSKYLK
jgi:predicted transcriptional regulator